MKGMEPSVVSAKAEQFFERNLKEEYPTTNGSLEQVRNLSAFQSGPKLQTTGTRTVLAVCVILNNGSYNHASQTSLSNDIFGNGVDLHNLRSQYAACLFNQLIFNKSPNRPMSSNFGDGTTAINDGVVDIRVSINCSVRVTNVLNAVTSKINLVFGVSNPNALANHVMYCLPSGVMTHIAVANIGSWMSWYTNEWCNMLSAQMHEVS
jgi:hypothetical protein